MKLFARKSLFFIALALVSGGLVQARAEGGGSTKGPAAETLVETTEELKARTEELVVVEEEKAAHAEATLFQLQKLSAEGLVARTEVEAAEVALAGARSRVEGLRAQLAEADRQLDVAAALAKSKPSTALSVATRSAGKYSATRTMIRFTGKTNSGFAGLAGVRAFFSSTFGRALPVSAVGQSATHNSFGYDHRHAVDVALHPDSVEGRALINYLQGQGITFIAFRASIPGVSTAPHIHIGRPSGRI